MASSKEERVHDVFQTISKRYDVMNSVISFQRHKAWRKDTMRLMDVQKGSSALDVCCGTADWTIAMADAVGESGSAIGLDFSENMLEVGHVKVNEKRKENVTLIHGNAMNLPFEDNSFDYVTIGFGLRNVPDYNQVIKEMYRVVKPGGQVVCLETSQPTIPVFKQVYYGYFKHVMPVLGKVFAKSYDEYSWLQESASTFPGREELKQLFFKNGFSRVDTKPYSGGVAAMHRGFKPVNKRTDIL
ncbi:demethylmenaquinone methyltransferase [Bacillus hwajinpoensis]|uniref:Demethylmenaquinone methyltransferase n=1 Tax=Guptibacillus hwajinpoensis TaxID=208199 RepID=A0A845EXV9_9BACL|nr:MULTISPECIES: demethylmenaquinone methyltransferase [Bacillaceae]MYL63369.1 demethylmenaquinone methyltransferase [Pseudalkalibacillus hwajinpoensis]PFG13626.1 demethylmenaquinone methyltransferase/2-methoxy-6-polyprenyl-1,4-benzoquinol methylase [Bacillus sp. es.036]